MDYTIKQGDNLSTIAKANNTTVGALASLNKLSNPNKIIAGQTLKLGVPTTNTNVANTAFNAPITQPQAVPPTIDATTIGSQTPIQVPTANIPAGWDIETYQNFKRANPTLEPDAEDTMMMLSADNFAQSKLDSFPQLEKTDAQKFQESTIFDILRGTQETAGESAMLQAEQEKANVEGLKTQYKQIADKIKARQAQLNQEYAKIGATPMSFAARSGYESAVRAAAESEIGALNAQAQAVAGDYEMAIDTAQRAVDAKYKPIKEKLALQKTQLEAIAPLLTADEKKQAQQVAYLLKQEEREYDKQIDLEKSLQTLSFKARENGAPNSIISAISNARNYEEAVIAIGRYIKEPVKASVPTIKSINGVDMQWDAKSGTWVTPTGVTGSSADTTQDTLDKFKFIRDTAKEADRLASAAGQSGIRRQFGNIFQGDSKYNQLEAYVNTLKTNMLTLATDPNIKKFFGPQMSNADVELMVSAGTTLNPKSQSEKQIKAEIKRIDDFINRAQTAVQTGQAGGNVMTAPDGTVIEIID